MYGEQAVFGADSIELKGAKSVSAFLAGHGKGQLNTGQALRVSSGDFFNVFDTIAKIAGVIDRPDYPNYGDGLPIASLINR